MKEHDHRFVVILDDLDRLEPKEAVEVLRLVRSVADFPNIVYILCYDTSVLSQSIEKSLGVTSGEKYLQKFVQVSFHIPKPEAFDLRYWLLDEVTLIFNFENPSKMPPDMQSELSSVVDHFGTMETPRDVISILNSIKFHYPSVKDDIYFPDLIWLHMIKILKPNLYHWCENYLSEWSVISLGDAQHRGGNGLINELSDVISKELDLDQTYLYRLNQYIPGLKTDSGSTMGINIFSLQDADVSRLVSAKRLGSPDHWRYYFAFSSPKTSMTNTRIDEISDFAENNQVEFSKLLLSMSKERRLSKGSWLDYFIERLKRTDLKDWSAEKLSNFVFLLTDNIDEIARSPILNERMGRIIILESAVVLVSNMLTELKVKNSTVYATTLNKVISDAKSIGWLLNDFIDLELRRHNIIKNSQYTKETAVLSYQESETARIVILDRLNSKIDRQRLYDNPNIGGLLFRWGDFDTKSDVEPRKWFAEFTRTDEQFVHVLEGMRGWSDSSSEGVTRPLSKSAVNPFTDWNNCLNRLRDIGFVRSANQKTIEKAQRLLSAIRKDRGE